MALGLVSMRLGRDASETIIRQHPVALEQVTPIVGEDGTALGLWAGYGVPIARPTEYATIVPIAEPDVQPSAQLRSARVPVYEGVNWQYLVQQYDDWPVSTMLRINYCESGGNPNAINYYNADGLFDYGGWQLHGDPRGLDPVVGTELAHEKYEASGLQPWISSRRCWAA